MTRFSLLAVLSLPTLLWTASWFVPLPVSEALECGESPFSFHRGRLEYFERVDYGGGTIQSYGDGGGLFAYIAILLGLRPACPQHSPAG